jgi:hypothetical protein
MIDPRKLDETSDGCWVWYKPAVGDWEKGRIKSWSVDGDMVFVVYKCDGKWTEFKNYTAAATAPYDLDFIKHEDHCRAPAGFVCACLPPNMEMKEEDFLIRKE